MRIMHGLSTETLLALKWDLLTMQKSLTRRLPAGHTHWLAVSHTPENISSTLLMTYYNPNLWRGGWGLDQFEAISLWRGQRLK